MTKNKTRPVRVGEAIGRLIAAALRGAIFALLLFALSVAVFHDHTQPGYVDVGIVYGLGLLAGWRDGRAGRTGAT